MKRRLFSALAVLGVLGLTAAGVGAWTSSAVGADTDPPPGVAFYALEVNGTQIGTFADLELRSGFVDPAALELGAKGVVLPAKTPPPTVTLKRGLTSDMELSAWHELALTGAASARRSASLVMYDSTAAPVARYNLQSAWPAKLELKSGGPGVLTESVTLVADRLQRVSP